MVANAFSFIAKVIETKRIRTQNFVLVDGSVHNIKPTMHKNNLPMTIVKQNEISANTVPLILLDILVWKKTI